MEKRHSLDMVNGPLLKNLFVFAVPLMFTNFLQMLFNAADTIIVGKFVGETALAAVGATGSIVFLLTSVFNGLSIGANVVVAKLLGGQDEEKTSLAVHTSIFIGLIGGILLAVLGLFFSRTLLSVMSTPTDIIDLSNVYMQIYFTGAVFLLVYNFGSAVLRSKGDTKRPLIYLMISGILNVGFNMFFVIVLHMSVAGVALATIISEGVSAVLVVGTLMREHDATRLDLRKLRLNRHITIEILKIGVPAGIQGMVFSVSNVVIQSSINSFGSSTIVAGNSAGANLENFVYIGMSAFTQATITFTSQNVGAHNYKAIKRILWITLVLATISALIVSLIVWFFGTTFLGLYTNEMAVKEVGMIRLTYVTLWLALNGVLDTFVSSMRGMGYSTMPTIIMLICICGVRLVWIWTVFAAYPSLEVIYLCFPISWVVCSVVQFILWHYTHKDFVRRYEMAA